MSCDKNVSLIELLTLVSQSIWYPPQFIPSFRAFCSYKQLKRNYNKKEMNKGAHARNHVHKIKARSSHITAR